LPVQKGLSDITPLKSLVQCDVSAVILKPVDYERSFFFREEGSCLREIIENEKCEDGDENRRNTFQNKD